MPILWNLTNTLFIPICCRFSVTYPINTISITVYIITINTIIVIVMVITIIDEIPELEQLMVEVVMELEGG